MKMTKVASKCAAVLCAAAIMLPAVGAVPASISIFNNTNSVVADSTNMTGDFYVEAGKQYTLEISMPAMYLGNYSLSDFSFQWYYSDDSSNLSWTKINGATGTTVTDTLPQGKKMRHYKVETTNTKTGEKHGFDWFSMRTANCCKVTTKLGSASVENSNGATYVKVPVTASGLYNGKLTGYTLGLKYDTSVFESATFYDKTGLSGMDYYSEDDKEYMMVGCDIEPVTVGSDGMIGYYMLKVKSGKTYNGSKLNLSTVDLMASGGDLAGVIQYGTAPTSTTINIGSSTTSLYPQVVTQVKNSKIGFKWNKVPGAQKYGIGIYQANKWVVKKQVDASVTTWTSPEVKPGKYRMVVLAKVNGEWVKADVFKHAFYVTVK